MSFQKLGCPNSQCQNTLSFKKDGYYFRRNDSRSVQRYQCLCCLKKFSRSTYQFEYRQHKRRVNHPLLKLLVSGVSQRRAALFLNINKNTVARKFDYLARKYSAKHQAWLKNKGRHEIAHVQFDDLVTIEHTKLKPLTVTSVVDPQSLHILSAKVGQIPSFGLIAKLSRAKYGKRMNEHPKCLSAAFDEIKSIVHPQALFESDEHYGYPPVVKAFFPEATHKAYKGGRGCITGQGELKKLGFDPLFAINHIYAMFRANINRLVRRTWCTTKKAEKLQQHLDLYVWFHNQVLKAY
jgi:transposase-like protein